MAAKPSSAENTGPSPPSISTADKLLSSVISLPANPHIVYAVFSPAANSPHHHECIELARRQILRHNPPVSVLDSLLPSVHISKDVAELYIFAVTSHDRIGDRRSTLDALRFDALTVTEISSFEPQDLYPCSVACSSQRIPCSTCLNPQTPVPIPPTLSCPSPAPPSVPASAPAVVCLLPRKPLRRIYSQFLEAVRNRLIDDISEASKKSPHARPVKRYKGGFLLGTPQNSSEWGTGWEHNAQSRPLIHCHIEVHLTASRIIIHPILRPTHFLPLPFTLPLPPGTPITLLPHGVPAYFLASYTGPSSALTTLFELSLTGLGAGEWTSTPPTYERAAKAYINASETDLKGPMFIIVWISVQNKQGEDKGMTAIWPARLALSYLPSSPSAHARQPLSYIPELPFQLQPSPPPPPASATAPDDTLSEPPLSQQPAPRLNTRRTCASPTSDSLRAFRSLTVSRSRDITKLAVEVGGYVDSIAKERERERERIRKERETGHASASPRTISTPNTGASAVSAVTPAPTLSTPSASQTAGTPTATTSASASLNNAPPANLLPPAMSSQHFYPSPPQTNPPSGAPPSVVASQSSHVALPMESANATDALPTVPAPPEPSHPPSYDPFGNLDSAWSEPTNDFMNMDYNMGFGMNMDPMSGGGNGGGGSDRMNMDFDDDFGAFTDDDFSFFDRPSAKPAAPGPSLLSRSLSVGSGLTPAVGSAHLGFSPPLFLDGIHLSEPGPPEMTPGPHHSSPWVHSALADSFSPRVHLGDSIPPIPQLLPPSPSKTPSSHSAPVTPNVQLSHDPDSLGRGLGAGFGIHTFDPIPFAPSHRMADGKYAVGKFALPSPPDEEDRTEPIPLSYFSLSRANGWQFKYKAATDPRIGVVRKLIGVKRKSFDQGSRDVKMSPTWVREREDWSSTVMDDAEDGKSDAESEEEEIEDEDDPLVSRPSTPLPSYLPKGPSLLHTYFHHSHLLPLCSPLRPPGAAVAPINIASAAPPVSVPTPVSPAAVLGAASEKSKSLEAAAYTVAKEVVENCVWADAWWSNSVCSPALKPPSGVWQNDVKRVAQLLEDVPALQGPLDMKTLFELESPPSTKSHDGSRKSLQIMESPMFSVGKGDAIVQVLPSALRFWDKLGLGPRAGKKDITAFVFFEEHGDEMQLQVENWLTTLSETYTSKHLGSHVAGACTACPKDGLVPLRLDSFRKNLASFVSSLPIPHTSLVFYIITPISTMTLASPLLRQVFSAVKRALKTYSEAQILFQFVPEYLVAGSIENSAVRYSDNERLCYSVYNRVLQPVDRIMSRRFFEHGERIRNYFQEPAFTLARPIHNKVKYLRQTPARSLDVIDRHTLLHVGYQVTPCRKWILAACVDQRGEAHDFGVWLSQSDSNEAFVVTQVWNFAIQFARKANIEWRIVFTKLGRMDVAELDTWMTHLAATVPTCYELPMMHVTLLSAEADAPWIFIASQNGVRPSVPRHKTGPRDAPGPLFVDASATIYAMYPSVRMALAANTACDLTDLTLIPDADDVPSSEDVNLLPLSSTILIRVPADGGCTATSTLHIHLLHSIKSPSSSLTIPDSETHHDITHNFHELAVLAEAQWLLGANPLLPFHLAALEVMHLALDPSGLALE